jgi:hypothetical protein
LRRRTGVLPDVDGNRHHASSMPMRVPASRARMHSTRYTAPGELRRAAACARQAGCKPPRGVAKTKQSVPSQFADPDALSHRARIAYRNILRRFASHRSKKNFTMWAR